MRGTPTWFHMIPTYMEELVEFQNIIQPPKMGFIAESGENSLGIAILITL